MLSSRTRAERVEMRARVLLASTRRHTAARDVRNMRALHATIALMTASLALSGAASAATWYPGHVVDEPHLTGGTCNGYVDASCTCKAGTYNCSEGEDCTLYANPVWAYCLLG
jgi:hypothetical protein